MNQRQNIFSSRPWAVKSASVKAAATWFVLSVMLLASVCFGQDLQDPASWLKADEKPAWKTYYAAVRCLQEEGNRERAAELFQQVTNQFPKSQYAAESGDLARLLRQLVEEDKKWVEPQVPETLAIDQKVAYYVYHLRDVNCHQLGQPGACSVFRDYDQKRASANAASKLKQIGGPAVPALISLLEDRRPIRAVGFWRDFRPYRTVLRYQDAAIEIIDSMLPAVFYQRSPGVWYFSQETPQTRAKVVEAIKNWQRKSRTKPAEAMSFRRGATG